MTAEDRIATPWGTRFSANDPTIIAASPLIRESFTMPYRVVLRNMGEKHGSIEYVVHHQIIPDGPDGANSYCWGHYFRDNIEAAKLDWLQTTVKSLRTEYVLEKREFSDV